MVDIIAASIALATVAVCVIAIVSILGCVALYAALSRRKHRCS